MIGPSQACSAVAHRGCRCQRVLQVLQVARRGRGLWPMMRRVAVVGATRRGRPLVAYGLLEYDAPCGGS
eukprot:2865177-Prymnesium_polylepis.3